MFFGKDLGEVGITGIGNGANEVDVSVARAVPACWWDGCINGGFFALQYPIRFSTILQVGEGTEELDDRSWGERVCKES
jgi:hypothetical protein